MFSPFPLFSRLSNRFYKKHEDLVQIWFTFQYDTAINFCNKKHVPGIFNLYWSVDISRSISESTLVKDKNRGRNKWNWHSTTSTGMLVSSSSTLFFGAEWCCERHILLQNMASRWHFSKRWEFSVHIVINSILVLWSFPFLCNFTLQQTISQMTNSNWATAKSSCEMLLKANFSLNTVFRHLNCVLFTTQLIWRWNFMHTHDKKKKTHHKCRGEAHCCCACSHLLLNQFAFLPSPWSQSMHLLYGNTQ